MKTTYSLTDKNHTLPVLVYKRNAAGDVVPDPIGGSMPIPEHDTMVIDESGAPTTTVITYKKDEATVATQTITVSGTTTTVTLS